MASMMISSAVSMARAAPAKTGNSIAPYVGLRQADELTFGRKAEAKLPSNRMKVSCMQVWPIEGKKKFETLSYLPDLSPEELLKQIEYLIRSNWIPCLEFSKVGFVYRENHRSPGYYDGRYWTMWKLPMFGCTDATQVAKEVEEAKKEYPDAFIRILGFDNVRQVQCISFIAYKPPGTY
ncbi:hypothetical protein LUZ61_015219 [Rhynchospora tenuis]|uniref:Ribulose bisphosphate carboxylase small subunit, chloroplastic n=1 Tax=Rhynchospora tenuis TaxID=198213 RepID=A0AAD5WCQ1_9POAL|nr:hypothetical protein LUZ61_015219 [Rhynchospora tenuis]